MASLIRVGEQTKFIALDVTVVASGDSMELRPGDERLVVMLSGRAEVVVDGRSLGVAGRQADVFSNAGDGVYVPPTSSLVLIGGSADDGAGFTAAVAAASAGSQPPGDPRIITGAEQREVVVGRDSWARTVRTILGPEDHASRLIVGETLHVGTGGWSSFPPHRHDRDSAEEAKLEEVYYYRVDPANGFAVQVRYDVDSGAQDVRMVRDGDSAAITTGFHPVVATPGHRLYYLWIMAGDRRELRPYLDPRYRWVNHQV